MHRTNFSLQSIGGIRRQAPFTGLEDFVKTKIASLARFEEHKARLAKNNSTILSKLKINCRVITTPAMKEVLVQIEKELGVSA